MTPTKIRTSDLSATAAQPGRRSTQGEAVCDWTKLDVVGAIFKQKLVVERMLAYCHHPGLCVWMRRVCSGVLNTTCGDFPGLPQFPSVALQLKPGAFQV